MAPKQNWSWKENDSCGARSLDNRKWREGKIVAISEPLQLATVYFKEEEECSVVDYKDIRLSNITSVLKCAKRYKNLIDKYYC